MSDLCRKSISELLTLLENKECSSVDIVESLADHIEAHDSLIQAYVHLNREEALAVASQADEKRASGCAGRLCGIPVSIKDVLNVKGQPCTCGSKILQGYTSPYDATAVARLRDEGAVLFGRVNMDEFAMGSSTENSALQVTKNPWNPDYVPGGSSGGSAAAVSADLAIASIGSDTGGSIRQPASFCGCVGLKPSYGRISRYGLTAYASSLDQIGPLTKTVDDAAVLLECMAGHDVMDSTSVSQEIPDFSNLALEGVKGLRLGLPREYFVDGMDPDVSRLVQQAAETLQGMGAELVEVELPHTEYAIATYYIIATAETSANLARFDGIRYGARVRGEDLLDTYCKTRAAGFGDEVKRRILLGTYVLSSGYYDAYYVRAQKARTLIRRDFEQAFSQCDALLAPVAPTPAFKIGEKTSDPLQMYLGDIFTVTANLAGICGMSVPCGFSSNQLPVGLQILGPAFREDLLFRVGGAYEQATEWTLKKPDLTGISAE